MSARDEEWRESRMCRKGMREGERKEKIERDLNTRTAKKQSSIVRMPIVWARRKGICKMAQDSGEGDAGHQMDKIQYQEKMEKQIR